MREVVLRALEQIKTKKVALFGNPNSGKTTLFNQLTGLNQKTGNFPGVTVDKKEGKLYLEHEFDVTLIDFPGTYSIYPRSKDERVVAEILCNPNDEAYPDMAVYVAAATNIEQHLLFFTQLKDLGIPTILVLTMNDIAARSGDALDIKALQEKLKTPILQINAKNGENIPALKKAVAQTLQTIEPVFTDSFYKFSKLEESIVEDIEDLFPDNNDYQNLLLAHHHDWLEFLNPTQKDKIEKVVEAQQFEDLKFQIRETMQRFDRFVPIIKNVLQSQGETDKLTDFLDRFFTHRIFGVAFFFLLMLLVFQAIFTLATYPMDWIDLGFEFLKTQVDTSLPAGWFSDLLTNGILAGLSGVLVFVPQIAILFFLITFLEEAGYMARAVFLFDRLMQRVGLNGRSIVALISGGACAIPAIMSTRTISNWKERLITILVTPLISCSARIPVYTVLIGFAVPAITVWGFITAQSIAFMGLYLLGIAAALLSALVFKYVLKIEGQSYLMLELPEYRMPVLQNVLYVVWEKTKAFILEAGKVIMVISLILWFLASFGPAEKMQIAEQEASINAAQQGLDATATDDLLAAYKLENSYAGHIGKWIEPVVAPLGFDWKIGIALITSFAAREVFVGTMATIYSIGSQDDEQSVRKQMAKEINPRTGAPVYNIATSASLLVYYVFAMQCMSTLAVVRKETGTWKWSFVQFVFMTTLAYLASLLTYYWLS